MKRLGLMSLRKRLGAMAGVLTLAVTGLSSFGAAPLQPAIREGTWKEASAVLERWQKAQGLDRSPAEVFPRASAHEILSGDATSGIKLRFVNTATTYYRVIVEVPGAKPYAEISDGGLGYWFLSEALGIGALPRNSDLVETLRRSRYDAAFVRKHFQAWQRLADETREEKRYHVVAMQQYRGGVEFWWFDAEMGVLVFIEAKGPTGKLISAVRFGDFRLTDGVVEPFLAVFRDGDSRTTIRTTEISNRVTVPSGFFGLTSQEMNRWRESEKIIANYVKACGGQAALGRIVTRVTKSTGENSGGSKFEITISQKAPLSFLAETHVAGVGRSWQGFDGETGWELSELKGFRAMRGGEIELFRRNGQLNVENFRLLYPLRQIIGVQMLNGRKVVAMELASLAGKAGAHYFEVESGQLVRVESVLALGPDGSLPVTIDFSDFRAVDGVTLPFKTVMSNPALQVVTTVESVKQNVELDDAIFKPRKEE